LRFIWVATTLALLVPGAATAGVPGDPAPEAEEPVTAPVAPGVKTPTPSPPPPASSVTITLPSAPERPPAKRQIPRKPPATTATVETHQPDPALAPAPGTSATKTTPRANTARRSVDPEPATPSTERTGARPQAKKTGERAEGNRQAAAKRAAAKRAAAKREAAKRKAAQDRARIVAGQDADRGAFTPPLAPLTGDISSSVTTEVAPVPTSATMILLAGVLLVVAASFVPGLVLTRMGKAVSNEVRLGVAAVGLTGVAVGLFMLLSGA